MTETTQGSPPQSGGGSTCIIIVGAPGQGKTRKAKEILAALSKTKTAYVFDVNNEYDEYAPTERDCTCDREYFTATISERDEESRVFTMQNRVILVEDATAFFSSRVSPKIVECVAAMRHTGNSFVFLFHSLFYVPENLMQFADWLILFKTVDELPKIQRKYPSLLQKVIKVRSLPKHSCLSIQRYTIK